MPAPRVALRVVTRLGLTLCLFTLGACQTGQPGPAPIEGKQVPATSPPPVLRAEERPPPPATPHRVRPSHHVVARGDTLHAIAWRFGLDYRELARWNRLRDPNLIIVGQRLRLTSPKRSKSKARPSSTGSRQTQKTVAAAAADKRAPPKPQAKLSWAWPAAGKTRVAKSVTGTRGLEIRGTRGQPIKAAAEGSVVYSGSGLRGYGELIIIKHNATFLSAYAHNEKRLVAEGQRVETGQLIARMGNTEARDVMLHFEIRRNGKSVDPKRYLPKR